MSKTDADKDKPTVELKGEQAKQALDPAQNPFTKIGNAINQHAQMLNELRNAIGLNAIDVKANRATAEIFDKRFGLVERQLDNIEKELSRVKEQLNKFQ